MIIRGKIRLLTIVAQATAVFFLVLGAQRLHMAVESKNYECLFYHLVHFDGRMLHDSTLSNRTIALPDCSGFPGITPGQFLLRRAYWGACALLLSIFLIALLNRENKIPVINTVVLVIILIALWFTGIYFNKAIRNELDIGYYFTTAFSTSNRISSMTFLILGILLLWLSLKVRKHRADKAEGDYSQCPSPQR